MRHLLSNKISMYFPKRLLLSFRIVLAFPKAFRKDGGAFRCLPLSCELGVTYFHDGVGSEHPLLDAGLPAGAADGGKVAHGVLGRDGFAGTGVAAHHDGLVPFISVLNTARKKTKHRCDWIPNRSSPGLNAIVF